MRHKKARHQLNRFSSWRKETLKALARNLLIQQRIQTTKARAFAVRPLIEKLISLAKTNTLAAKREVYKTLGDHSLVSLLFRDIAPRFNNRTGGYSRLMNLGKRRGDNAQLVILELTEIKKKEVKKIKKEKETPPTKEIKKPQAQEEKPPIIKKPTKRFLGGIRNIFKKERDSL